MVNFIFCDNDGGMGGYLSYMCLIYAYTLLTKFWHGQKLSNYKNNTFLMSYSHYMSLYGQV